jgi:hypothetical protein
VVLTYIDSSVALAYLFAESRLPRENFWDRELTSSRLLEYEVWNRIHARGRIAASSASAQALLSGVELLEMTGQTLERALRPFPLAVRTLDGLHLATIEFIRARGDAVELASYDNRLITAARRIGIPIALLQ